MDQKKYKNSSPRVKVIQKIYGSLMNPDEKIIYPNPVTNKRIYITNTGNKESILLYNAIGRKVEISNRIYDSTTNTTMILVNTNIEPGLYILSINEKIKRIIIIKN